MSLDIHPLIHAYKQMHIHIFPARFAYQTECMTTHRGTHTVLSVPLSVSQVSFYKLVPTFSDSCVLSQIVLKATNLLEFSHFVTKKQINSEWLSSSGSNLLSFAKLHIFDRVCQSQGERKRKKKKKSNTKTGEKEACFLKAKETALEKKMWENQLRWWFMVTFLSIL